MQKRYMVGTVSKGKAFKPLFTGLELEVIECARLLHLKHNWPKNQIAFVDCYNDEFVSLEF
jgi:hypothetical protein